MNKKSFDSFYQLHIVNLTPAYQGISVWRLQVDTIKKCEIK
jgi:hypothetical protein